MMKNPLEFKHHVVGAPLKEIIRRMGPSEEWTDESVMLALYVGFWTAGFNLLPAATLIQAGVRGETYFSGLSIGYHASGFPKPMFNYITPASSAERVGHRVGSAVGSILVPARAPVTWTGILGSTKTLAKGAASGARVGGKLGARIGGRLIPGVGWALLAYDAYDIAFNQSLWGFDLPI